MKWQGLEIELVDCEDGVIELSVDGYCAVQFKGDKKEVEYVENGITLNDGLTSVVSFDPHRNIGNPGAFTLTIPDSDDGGG